MLKLAVCVSGGGSNLQAIIDGIANGQVREAQIGLVISNNAGVKALDRAAAAGIPTRVVSPADYETRQAFEEAFCEIMRQEAPDLVVLAGFLVRIPMQMVQDFPERIINIHPSLIPSFCGKGCYGIKVHEMALARGVRVSGATVHFVDGELDTGPILLQKPVLVRPEDTPKSLQQRIMEEAEWKILPRAIDILANGRVHITEGRAVIEAYTPNPLSDLEI
ncbi:MAG: phosphoribosylglycinamide formyltransferase [Butyrivibrio sp.]|nr:phosphoribosylglycinamide formyltransferase [Butyrivibrio sp.]